MTLKEKVICEAYTGICFCTGEDRNELYKYLSEKMGRPVYSHEFATNFEKIRDISREDFVKVCKGDYNESSKETVRQGEWIILGRFTEDQTPKICVQCPCCGEEYTYKVGRLKYVNYTYAAYNFCPNCGVKLSGGKG